MSITLHELNELPVEQALLNLGGLYEHSPWIPEAALKHRPFKSLAQLKYALVRAVREAGREIGKHVSVVGFDDSPLASRLWLRLQALAGDRFERASALAAGTPIWRLFHSEGLVNLEATVRFITDVDLRA